MEAEVQGRIPQLDRDRNHIEPGVDGTADEVAAAVVGHVNSSSVDPDRDAPLEQLILVDDTGLVVETKNRKDADRGHAKLVVGAGYRSHQHLQTAGLAVCTVQAELGPSMRY